MTWTSTVAAPALLPLSETVYAYVQPDGGWGFSNAGLVASGGEALLVDTQYTPQMTRHLIDAITSAVPGVSVSQVVTTHANGDHCWGLQLLPDAEVIATAASVAHQCREITPQQMTAMQMAEPTSELIRYVQRHFPFDFTEVEVRQPTRTFSGSAELAVGSVPVELIEVGPAHTQGDAVVHVPQEGIVFAGDVLFIGAHTVVWDSIAGCVAALSRILATGATRFVPGHGPVVGRSEVAMARDALEFIAERAFRHAQSGTPLMIAARRIMRSFLPDWAHPERIYTSVASAYSESGVDGVPSDSLSLASGMAELACWSSTSAVSETMNRND
ncbi:MBL fold metallo-hydrolase [Streptomyces sp. NPDC001127]|uniref:MBL fold metallo-hydrolase n=1 Tax=Streptomyces sp. NPDC001127 TaxID=3154377 RepID=UPI00332C6920